MTGQIRVATPYEYYPKTTSLGDTAAGLIKAAGNAAPNCANVGIFNDTVFTPRYSCALETPANAKAYVRFGRAVPVAAVAEARALVRFGQHTHQRRAALRPSK